MKQRRSVDFNIKATWLAIQKMYNVRGGDYELTHSTGFVLLNIDPDNGTPATKIAPLMGMEARSLSRMLKSMEEEKVICRKEDAGDKRKVIICLTEEGRRRREWARNAVREFNSKVREQISAEHLQVFTEVVRKIADIADTLRLEEDQEVKSPVPIESKATFKNNDMPFEI
jgi:MarR family transcriptional regulator, organic hydroperoxide resistance regulator